MSSFNPKAYGAILRVHKAMVFDLGGLLVRMYAAQTVLGIVTMLTLSGWSFLMAGTVSAVAALATFLISPQVSRQIDLRGQSKVAPYAACISLAGILLILFDLVLEGPFWLCHVGAVLMGFTPNAQSMTRTRWTYMVETGRLGEGAPDLKTVFAYEGVFDDAAFMLGPSLAIALSSALFPTAGMIMGAFMFTLGITLLLIPRSTEPEPGWKSVEEQEAEPSTDAPQRSMFLSSGIVRALFAMILVVGFFYSTHDTVLVAVGQQIGAPAYISIILVAASLLSMVCGFVFGMIKLKASLPQQMLVLAVCYGLCYGMMGIAPNIPLLTVVCIFSAVFYGPLVITVNTLCERNVPSERLTESLTWVNSGYTCGSAVAPIAAGLAIDVWGGLACLKLAGGIALLVALYGLVIQPYLRKNAQG